MSLDERDLLGRPVYGTRQVERVLGLPSGTARRWLCGYRRRGKLYPPVIRAEPNDDEIVTWGEFVETRLLAEYRESGVPLIHLRPAIIRLREELATPYPLAVSRPFVDVAGKELVFRIQNDLDLASPLKLVVIRNDQLMLAEGASAFVDSVRFGEDGVVHHLQPFAQTPLVTIDPLRQFGEPVVRSVRTEVIAEQYRAGEGIERIAGLYELSTAQVEDAIRYELLRAGDDAERAA